MTTSTITIEGRTVGSVSANSLDSTHFTNPVDSILQNTSWTPLNNQYLAGPDANHFSLKSIGTFDARDVEVTTWARDGVVFLRLDGTGKALYFSHNGETTNGTLEVGIVTGLDETAYPGGTRYALYQNTNLVGAIPGSAYNRTDTTGATFTFGVSGFDIYLKFNGVEFARWKEYRHMASGAVAFKANTGYGFRDITWTTLANASLFSNYAANELDLRDWNVRSLQTTGTISSGSNSLAIASNPGFQVGDWVIVEIGAEAGAGLRGTVGVGGQWPALSYANATALAADTSQASFTYAWTRDTGNVYQFGGSAADWSSATTYAKDDKVSFSSINYQSVIDGNLNNEPDLTSGGGPTAAWVSLGAASGWTQQTNQFTFYTNKAIPYSLHGRISAISGGGLTLTLLQADGVTAANASATATNANVYLDNQPYVNWLTSSQQSNFYSDLSQITPQNMTIIFPSGSFAGSGAMVYAAANGWTIKGQGQASTTLFSPFGVYSLHFGTNNVTGFTFKDFTISGNFSSNNKFGLAIDGWTYLPGGVLANGTVPALAATDGSVLKQNLIPQGSCYPAGIHVDGGGVVGDVNATIQDITVNDVFQKAVGVDFSNNVWAYRVTNNEHAVLQCYVQWQFQWANCTGGGAVDCVVNSLPAGALRAGFESFGSFGHQMIRCIANNAAFSQNTSGGWLMKDCAITVTANPTGSFPPAWDKNNPLVNLNSNIGVGPIEFGGTIKNINITVQGYLNTDNDLPCGISINPFNPNISVIDGSYTAPDWASPSTLCGAQGVRSFGLNAQVIRFKNRAAIGGIDGTLSRANIGMQYGHVYRCDAPTIVALNGVITSPTAPGVYGLRMKN